MRVSRSIVGIVIVAALLVPPLGAQQNQTPAPEGAAADFQKRVEAYIELRDKLNAGAAKLDETAKPEEIAAAETALAARIQAARSGAKPGDIFTPAVQSRFRQLLNPEMKGTRGQNTRGIIFDEAPGPGAVALKVNVPYPEGQPLGTVPPNILQSLPPLPDGIEYRFVYRHLVLRDARANLIIDFMPAAIPGQ
jgi:hypothetical protein